VVSAAAIALWLLSNPGWVDKDTTREDRVPFVRRYAEAIVAEAPADHEVALLLAHGWEETKFAHLVLSGHCDEMPAGQRCDSLRARGAFSLHRNACPAAYRYDVGSAESIREEVRCTLGLLYYHSKRCREHAATPLLGMFGGMGGTGCHAPRAAAKVLAASRIAKELAKLEAES